MSARLRHLRGARNGRPMTACGIVLSERDPDAILVVDAAADCTICVLRSDGLPPAIAIPLSGAPVKGEG